MRKKEKLEKERLEKVYEIRYEIIDANMRKYSRLLEKPVDTWDKMNSCEASAFIELNGGGRKTSAVDPYINHSTYRNYRNGLSEISKAQPMRFGDDKSPVVFDDVDRALKVFKEDMLLAQDGVLKDKRQRKNQFKDRSDPTWVPNSIVVKPTAIYSAADTVEMVRRLREYFNLTLKTRPTGKHARKKIGRLIDSRTFKKSWSGIGLVCTSNLRNMA